MLSPDEDLEERCPDCGARVAGGRAGCQSLFEEVLVRDYSDYRYGRSHRLVVDVYSLQHPSEYMRSAKSFAAHLTGVCSALDSDETSDINRKVQKWLSGRLDIERPEQDPAPRGNLTIAYIHSAADPDQHHQRVREWAESAWKAWSDYHALAREWIHQATARAT